MRKPYITIIEELIKFALSVFLLSVLVFTLARLAPGDPLYAYYGERVEKMSGQEQEAARERLGLDEPIPVQYMRWAKGAAHGDFGISYQYKRDVTDRQHPAFRRSRLCHYLYSCALSGAFLRVAGG